MISYKRIVYIAKKSKMLHINIGINDRPEVNIWKKEKSQRIKNWLILIDWGSDKSRYEISPHKSAHISYTSIQSSGRPPFGTLYPFFFEAA